MEPTGSRPVPRQGVRVDVRARGIADSAFVELTRQAVAAVVSANANAAGPVRLRVTAGRCASGPVLVQVNLLVRGEPARVQIAARTPQAAAGAALDRLERQIRRLALNLDLSAWPLPWRRTLAASGEGAVARLKAVRLHTAAFADAAMRLTAMDYDAHLFTDADTGLEAVVYRTGTEQLRLARQQPGNPSMRGCSVQVDARPALVLDPAHAARRLEATAAPFVFYTDRDTGRGNLLYRRYDGELGLISPLAAEPWPSVDRAPAEAGESGGGAGQSGSQPREEVGVLLEIENSRTASARSSTAAAV
ncbi:sigma 54 modulation/S30EA ribosomal C-terminal domain-containing protein [Catellatospora coxensis]|uniref:Sigma 54 modulation/S30EA ribosomal protein C-terminal domain-containing protein n=1 Tax=Catellatospora coxensis TaxID=310354 RepID=A0A8J3P628_9ACTN|nr:sigma 54 modulation/S30EA ribosomal C-terminal domain-containing protein [Catellatospora coxensis]GIG05059.1 hypothetical protein Cco03nite_17590 [Catellatospora coxensis]